MRGFLDGRFANTAFCVLSPDGKTRLSESHRSPGHVFGREVASSLEEISSKYEVAGPRSEAAVPDFPNFRLALNVSSADQRLLVVADEIQRETLREISNDPELMGRFNYDFESDLEVIKKPLNLDDLTRGIHVISPDAYGQSGTLIATLPQTASIEQVKEVLLKANDTFAKEAPKKVYRTHVSEGRKKGLEWKMPMEYGEDRNGDGKIDRRRGRGPRR